VSAAATLRVEDYFEHGKRAGLRLHQKGGKRHEVPCHRKLATYLVAYSTCCHTFSRDRHYDLLCKTAAHLKHAQQIAAHESPRTTKFYDRTQDEISFDEVERIRI
jgi:integrase/recombinase XerD